MSSIAPFLPLGLVPGFEIGSGWAIALLFVGVALAAGVGAMSHQHRRAFSASMIYLGLGVVAAVILPLLGGTRIDPIGDAKIVERIAELALVVAVFTAGLKIERRLRWAQWRSVVLLIGAVMPLTIALVAVFGTQVMGLSLGAALLLGAILAPTDPVLAGDVGVGPPGEEQGEEPRFAITAEAGLNDGLASPFVLLGIFVASRPGTSWLGEWILADVLYATVLAVLIGAVGGYGLGALVLELRRRELLAAELDGFVALAAPLILYGATEALGAYGLVAGFVGGVAFRRYEFSHTYNRRVHDGAETVEKLFELAVVLLLGSMLTLEGLEEPGLAGWLLIPLLLLVIRPLAVAAVFVRSTRTGARGRAFVGWFGVRGVAALFYAAFVVESNVLTASEQSTVVWTVLLCVAVSILVHGATSTPLGRLADDGRSADAGASERAASQAA